jgi:hypothetical protein
MRIGKLEIEIWKDTGSPKFRVWWGKGCTVYSWIFKLMSYYTLWIAMRTEPHEDEEC